MSDEIINKSNVKYMRRLHFMEIYNGITVKEINIDRKGTVIRMGKWILIDRAPSGFSGAVKKRLTSALENSGIPYETRITWTGPFTENTLILAINTDPFIYNITAEKVTAPESVQIFQTGKALALSGSDARGLGYAITETAERVEAYGEKALLEPETGISSPSAAIRGMDKIVCNTDDAAWWMSEEYWRRRLGDMLAARFNRLTLLVGYDTSYLSPPYPYFIEVPEYPGVRVDDPKINRGEYLAALRRLGRLAHEYGMDFTFASWQQTNWVSSQKSKITGIDDLMEYCSAGIRELALQCPEIDTIQLRVNHEAGVGTQVSDEAYWFRQLDGLAEAKRLGSQIKLEMRAKGLTDPMIRYAKELGLDLTVSTKYWCEQAGLPHHLTRMRTEELTRLDNFNHSRRYSYSDMLKKPRFHKFTYRLWNDGSTDIFTWGDPDYCRRFVASLKLGESDGFEFMPMLSLKGGPEDGKVTGWNLFRDPAYQPEGCEESRYWLCDRLFGRLSYNVNEDAEAWLRPMRLRYGNAADSMLAAIAAASRVIPFIIGYHMPVHPQLNYWAEFSTGGALFAENNYNPAIKRAGVTYQSTEPGDAGLFYPIDEFVRDSAAGNEDGRYTPWQTTGVLRDLAADALKHLAEAENAGLPDSNEARGAALDIKMIARLASYHRYKIAASVNLCKYGETGDNKFLTDSLAFMIAAKEKWAAFAELGQKYCERLVFYVGNHSVCRDGNWKDFYPELDADIARLAEMRDAAEPKRGEPPRAAGKSRSVVTPRESLSGLIPEANIAVPCWIDDVPDVHDAGTPLSVTLKINGKDTFREGVNLRYRHTNQLEGKFLSVPMAPAGCAWLAEIPASYITPEWDLLVYFEAAGANGEGIIFPGLWNDNYALPYHIVKIR